ncbi:hypothetical protein ACOTJG_07155 [Achromobacter xylosoxidans]
MYRGFNLNLDGWDFDGNEGLISEGGKILEKNKAVVRKNLELLKNASGELVASSVISEWFPSVKADIFISHSHRDAPIVNMLAGWLSEEMGLSSFIDSSLWGFAPDLLKIIDNEFCYYPEKKIYDYNERNLSTSHVYMMLSTSIAKMINNCEVVIFVNTPNSISTKEYIKGRGATASPWIYSEIALASLIQRKTPEEHRTEGSVKVEASLESLKVKYDLDMTHLTELSTDDLLNWSAKIQQKGTASLDALYSLKA